MSKENQEKSTLMQKPEVTNKLESNVTSKDAKKNKKVKSIQYDRWGYFFIAPFFIVYIIFSLIPLLSTFFYSFFENYNVGLTTVGPNWVGLQNYFSVFKSDILRYTGNTIIMWIIGFVPQIVISLLLAACFTNTELKIKGQQFFKTVIYMPNLIMASAFSMLFFTLFSPDGPINSILIKANVITEGIRYLTYTSWTRVLVAAMNFLMWYGNTTILLMAGIMGIDESLFEAARIDGASPLQVFFKITLPLLLPILVYVLITSMIGGIQMFDVPQILTNGEGNPNRTSMTLIMYLNKHLYTKNYGMAGAVSVLTFIVTGILSGLVYKSTMSQYSGKKGGN
ncbi:MAG: sugar ABC transporter permease [Treponema sp.]